MNVGAVARKRSARALAVRPPAAFASAVPPDSPYHGTGSAEGALLAAARARVRAEVRVY